MNLTVIAGLAAVGVIAAAATPTSVHSAVATARSASALLVGAGEMPGFDPLSAKSATHAGRFVRQLGPQDAYTRQFLTTLKRNGFQFGIQEHLRSSTDPNADAESLALELRSVPAARRELAAIVSLTLKSVPGSTIDRTQLPLIQNAVVLPQTAAGRPGGAANVYFASGRCVFFVGDAVTRGDPVAAPVAAVTKLHERATAACAQLAATHTP
jgi:hypothetical protein